MTARSKSRSEEAMTGGWDRHRIAMLIEDGRARDLPALDVADRIVALAGDPAWAKAHSHPARGTILRMLRDEGPMSPSTAAGRLGDASLGTISYHFRVLNRLGLVRVSEEIPRRGAIEHVYQLAESPR